MHEPPLNLNRLVDTALRGVVRQALAHVAEFGVLGDQQFLLDFRTNEDGVEIPSWLREQFPEQIRIVLQHQFWNLVVGEDDFSVDVRFGGTPTTLVVPFTAIEAFVDPSVPFGLSFHSLEDQATADEPIPVPEEQPENERGERTDAEVVQLDAFRKR